MKKSIFILLLLAVTISIQAQTYGELAVYNVSLELDAYEHSNGIIDSGNLRAHTLIVDDFYDIHLVKSKFNHFVNQYSDVEYVDIWRWEPDNKFFNAVIDVNDLEIYIGYSEINQTCIVLYEIIEGDKIIK